MDRWCVALVIALLAGSTSTVHAETLSGHYEGGSAYAFGLGAGFVLLPDGRDLDRDDQSDLGPIGGVTLRTEGAYRNARVTIDDTAFGARAATNVCMHNPDGDLICNADDHATGVGCSPQHLRDAPQPVRFVTVFVYSIAITESLDVCGATRGTIEATLY